MRSSSLLVAMAGLPGTGKSTLARRLAAELGGAVLDKDSVRQALFGGGGGGSIHSIPSWVEYSAEQDDFVLGLMLLAAERLITVSRCPAVFLDGRTFSRACQLDMVRRTAAQLDCRLRVVECVCDPEIALARIRKDGDSHLAKNRNADLYWRVRNSFEPIPEPKFLVDTGQDGCDATLSSRLVTE